jgi:cold shock CspA family protein
MDTTSESSSPTQNKMLTGCVKWFNNTLNYGFITVLTEGEHHNMDIFSHQSNIKTKRECFRTLYTGECVQFELAKSDNEKHPVHAINISGFNGCLLHCENPSYRINSNVRDNRIGNNERVNREGSRGNNRGVQEGGRGGGGGGRGGRGGRGGGGGGGVRSGSVSGSGLRSASGSGLRSASVNQGGNDTNISL